MMIRACYTLATSYNATRGTKVWSVADAPSEAVGGVEAGTLSTKQGTMSNSSGDVQCHVMLDMSLPWFGAAVALWLLCPRMMHALFCTAGCSSQDRTRSTCLKGGTPVRKGVLRAATELRG